MNDTHDDRMAERDRWSANIADVFRVLRNLAKHAMERQFNVGFTDSYSRDLGQFRIFLLATENELAEWQRKLEV